MSREFDLLSARRLRDLVASRAVSPLGLGARGAGFGADGMPVGLQIVGRLHREADVMRVTGAFEATQPEGYNLRPFTA